jgi:hypothetical protein
MAAANGLALINNININNLKAKLSKMKAKTINKLLKMAIEINENKLSGENISENKR